MPQFTNVVFTLNNPVAPLVFNDDKMQYLVYQKEEGQEGTPHFQGYCEFKKRLVMNAVKELLGGDGVHIEARRGTQEQAIAYSTKEDTRVDGPWTFGEPKQQGRRVDLEGFAADVKAGKRKRDLYEDNVGIIARYPKFYDQLTMMHRPVRTTELSVTLLYGDTGLGKTRTVMDRYGADDDFFIAPLNNGTMWYDTYDGHTKVLLDDFAGKMSHLPLTSLLRLLDRYPVLVPTKGGHTWWLPNEVYVTTNILPKDWYSWEGRGEHYKALARRFSRVVLYYVPLSSVDPGHVTQDNNTWWKENAPPEALY